MNIAIIPARGGSKRIPRKNIKLFGDKPIIARSIETALATKVFDRVIVSTDDDEIAEIAKRCGAEVPFVRPEDLADDYAGTTEVISHAIKWMINSGCNFKAACCIYPVAPFTQALDIVDGLKELEKGGWAFTFSAAEYSSPIYRSFNQIDGKGVEMLFPEYFFTRTQDLSVVYHDAGQFYWGLVDSWLQEKKIFEPHSKAIIIPRWRVHDIDTLDDWRRAEIMDSYLKSRR